MSDAARAPLQVRCCYEHTYPQDVNLFGECAGQLTGMAFLWDFEALSVDHAKDQCRADASPGYGTVVHWVLVLQPGDQMHGHRSVTP